MCYHDIFFSIHERFTDREPQLCILYQGSYHQPYGLISSCQDTPWKKRMFIIYYLTFYWADILFHWLRNSFPIWFEGNLLIFNWIMWKTVYIRVSWLSHGVNTLNTLAWPFFVRKVPRPWAFWPMGRLFRKDHHK